MSEVTIVLYIEYCIVLLYCSRFGVTWLPWLDRTGDSDEV